MSTVVRYDLVGEYDPFMQQMQEGDYVLYSSYMVLQQQRDELLAALVKHGKHGIHCRPEYMISTGQIIGYKCVDISCPVATAIAKAGAK